MIVLLTVPHTGTNFAARFLKSLPGLDVRNGVRDPNLVDVSVWHSNPLIPEITLFKRAIITLRHPHESAMTDVAIGSPTIERHMRFWDEMLRVEPLFDERIFLPLDTPDRLGTLTQVARFVGALNEGRRATDRQAEVQAAIAEWANTWPRINAMNDPIAKKPLVANEEERLSAAVEWYDRCRTLHLQSL